MELWKEEKYRESLREDLDLLSSVWWGLGKRFSKDPRWNSNKAFLHKKETVGRRVPADEISSGLVKLISVLKFAFTRDWTSLPGSVGNLIPTSVIADRDSPTDSPIPLIDSL